MVLKLAQFPALYRKNWSAKSLATWYEREKRERESEWESKRRGKKNGPREKKIPIIFCLSCHYGQVMNFWAGKNVNKLFNSEKTISSLPVSFTFSLLSPELSQQFLWTLSAFSDSFTLSFSTITFLFSFTFLDPSLNHSLSHSISSLSAFVPVDLPSSYLCFYLILHILWSCNLPISHYSFSSSKQSLFLILSFYRFKLRFCWSCSLF